MIKIKHEGFKSNFTTGLKASVLIILIVLSISFIIAALPVILPILFVVLIGVAVVGVCLGFIQILGFIINLFKK